MQRTRRCRIVNGKRVCFWVSPQKEEDEDEDERRRRRRERNDDDNLLDSVAVGRRRKPNDKSNSASAEVDWDAELEAVIEAIGNRELAYPEAEPRIRAVARGLGVADTAILSALALGTMAGAAALYGAAMGRSGRAGGRSGGGGLNFQFVAEYGGNPFR